MDPRAKLDDLGYVLHKNKTRLVAGFVYFDI